ncbi:MAG: hypothetical protein Q7J59_06050 [Elusimicrobiota bacterium]|nr:hypothetical protein [Elusimicrobiota bacterium]
MSVFEAAMLICFGISWPVSIAKTLRTGIVTGKSPLFMGIVCFGYLCGLIHKILYSFDWITTLYALNMIMVAIDLRLYYAYLPAKPGPMPNVNLSSRRPDGRRGPDHII